MNSACIYQPVKTKAGTVAAVDFMTDEQREGTCCHCENCRKMMEHIYMNQVFSMPDITDKTFYYWVADLMGKPTIDEGTWR